MSSRVELKMLEEARYRARCMGPVRLHYEQDEDAFASTCSLKACITCIRTLADIDDDDCDDDYIHQCKIR